MSDIRNTTEEMKDPANAMMFLAEGLAAGGSPGPAIERMEAEGQRQLVNSDRLPTECGDEAEYVALGFTFGDPDPRDPMFRPATLPAGWKRQGTDHSMWSKILDEHGRERVAIFYKAAFYDRSAHMSLTSTSSYLRGVLYDDAPPVLDDKWLTPEVAREELEKIEAWFEQLATEAHDAATRSNPDYWTGRAAEHRADALKARRYVTKHLDEGT